MTVARSGGCLCGAIRYQLKSEPKIMGVCHCSHCAKQSGSVFSVNIVVPVSDYVQTGQTKVFKDTGDSGQPVYRHFCGDCGSPILSKMPSMEGVAVVVKAGTLDDATGLSPAIEVYTVRAVSWLGPVQGTKRFDRAPT
jgi:hypothetical protein